MAIDDTTVDQQVKNKTLQPVDQSVIDLIDHDTDPPIGVVTPKKGRKRASAEIDGNGTPVKSKKKATKPKVKQEKRLRQ